MGGRGGSSGINSISNQIAGKTAELKYAQSQASRYGSVKYGGTKATRERYEMWSKQVKTLQKEISELEKKKRKKQRSSDYPLF